MLPFKSNGHLTMGVEIELQLLDGKTFDLTPQAIELLNELEDHPRIKSEIFQSMLEINTGICKNVQEVERDLCEDMQTLQAHCEKRNVLIASTGTHPFAKYADQKLFPAERYEGLVERNKWIARRIMIFAMHTHLGMRDGDTCIRFNNFFLRFTPHLIALSASSPFWQADNTGLASCRTTIFESSPTAGHPCRMKNWQDFSNLCDQFLRTQAITELKDIWWDVRPSPNFGTMEIRVCDGPANMQETTAISAFIHALAHWYDANMDYGQQNEAPAMWVMRENKWRATRYGMDATLIDYDSLELVPVREDIIRWMRRIESFAVTLGYQKYWEDLLTILNRGTSQQRQLKVFTDTGSLKAVSEHNAREFAEGAPIY